MFIICLASTLCAQEWKVITCGNVPFFNSELQYENNPFVVKGDTLFVATEGGVYMRSETDEKLFTVADGLLSTYRITAIAKSFDDGIWAASTDNTLSKFYPQKDDGERIDLLSDEQSISMIHLIREYQGNLLVTTNVGLSRIKYSNTLQDWIVAETIRDFGAIGRNPSIYDLEVYRDTIWIATNRGLVFADFNSTMLQSPVAWNAVDLLRNRTIYDIQWVNDSMFVSTDIGVYLIQNNTALSIRSGWTHFLGVWNGQLLYSGSSGIRKVSDNTLVSEDRFISFFAASDSHIYTYYFETDSTYGQYVYNDVFSNQWRKFIAKTVPYYNLFQGARFNDNQIAIIGGGARTRGVYLSQDDDWFKITKFSYPQQYRFFRQDPRTMKIDKFGNLWIGSGGGGLGIIYAGTDSLQYFDESSETGSHLVPYSLLYNETVVSSIDFLSNGRIVLTNDEALDRQPLVILPEGAGVVTGWENGNWLRLGNAQGFTSFLFNRLIVDPWDRVWLASATNTSQPLAVYDFKQTIDNPNDDIVREFRSNIGLPESYTISSMAFGAEAILYLATSSGLYYARIHEDLNNLRFYPLSIPQSNNQVNSLTSDHLGQIWIGTDDGIYLLSADGQNWITTIKKTRTKTGLSTNRISSLFFEMKTGELFVTNDGGIAILKTPYRFSSSEQPTLELSPNPFILKGGVNLSFGINGLPAYSNVLIFSPSGLMIKELNFLEAATYGWDGKNGYGDWVASGIYLVVLKTQTGKRTYSKLAVVNP
ncbi:MAG: hypothetical protein N2450_03625 [bacterium]|nr:hypothetical protein [bacterium]